ncbi:MAG: leucyl aminopeptidase [Alphaproteobacteria bacterium]|nr:leucyl aminopeptidase [Alphaproteobacteria bacterium]
MTVTIAFGDMTLPRTGTLIVGALADRALTKTAAAVDKRMQGALARAIRASRFTGAEGQFLEVLEPQGMQCSRIIVAGMGKPEAFDALKAEAIGGGVIGRLNGAGETAAMVALDVPAGCKLTAAQVAAHVGYGADLGSYRFDRYRTKVKPEQKPTLETLTVGCEDAAGARRLHAPLGEVARGVELSRNLVSEPANVIYPVSMAAEARKLSRLGAKVEVLGRERMRKLGMGALLGVAQGSEREPQLVIMRWQGGGRRRPIAFVGKGVTFDTGGISIKPAAGMEDMKWDMAGAGVVVGLMRALAGRKAKVNAVGVVGLVENMPSATAQRPGDVVTSMSGQTIEVINTDAEGRLVLADAVWYTQKRFKPEVMIDLATLTGAIIVALGSQHAGLFANDDGLAEGLIAAGTAVGERLWRLPVDDSYADDIRSDIADVKNVGANRSAGSIAGAKFIELFVNKVPWAHLDIAGVAWSKKDKPTVPKGGTGFGVRLLDRFVAERYER